jgi:hypothetical protein
MADDKDDAAKAKALMHQLSGVLNNPVMRSLMGSGSFGQKGEVAKAKPAAPPGQAPASAAPKANTALPGMMPSRPLPPIKPLPGMRVAGGSQGQAGMQAAAALVSKIPREQLAPLLLQLQEIVTTLDQYMKALAKIRGGNPALKKQIRAAVGQIVAHLPMLIMQLQQQIVGTATPEAKALPALIEQIQAQLHAVDEGLDDEKK